MGYHKGKDCKTYKRQVATRLTLHPVEGVVFLNHERIVRELDEIEFTSLRRMRIDFFEGGRIQENNGA